MTWKKLNRWFIKNVLEQLHFVSDKMCMVFMMFCFLIYIYICCIKIRYQKEIDRLEKENKELRKQMLLKDMKGGKKIRTLNVSNYNRKEFYGCPKAIN